jgi:glycosyltransferase involved in cell wall biosynthesis
VTVDDVRWFAPNRYCTLPVPTLLAGGVGIALEGDAPARLAVAADGQCAVAAFEYARRHRVPLLLYLWDLPPWRLGRGRPDPVFELGGRIRRIPRPFGRYRERAGYYSRIGFVARRAAEVWCPSAGTVADVRRRFGVAAARVPFCYDSERFTARDGGRGSGGAAAHAGLTPPFSILAVSRLVPHKNLAVVIEAVARLDPRPPVRLIGHGPEAGPLRRLAAARGVPLELDDRWAPDEAVVAAYRVAGVVVAPSRFEGFGLTPIEAVAMGVPAVASDIPAHREFLGDRVRYFPPDDPAALARELTAALREPSGSPSFGFPDLTIDACATRFRPGLERLLGGAR